MSARVAHQWEVAYGLSIGRPTKINYLESPGRPCGSWAYFM